MNQILEHYKLDGTTCTLDDCDYIQLKLLGPHATECDANILISKQSIKLVTRYKWYLGKDGYPTTFGYRGRSRMKLHRFLHRPIPKGYVVDHINRDRLDNRLANLRICTQKENSYNTSKRNGKYKGVRKCAKNKYAVKLQKDGKIYEIKDLDSEVEAAKMYDIIAEELFGQYAGKNFATSRNK